MLRTTEIMKAWRKLDPECIQSVKDIPTMLSQAEQIMLFHLASQFSDGGAVLLDLGCYLGGSTARLALGAASKGKPYQLHAFDLFEFGERAQLKYIKDPTRLHKNGVELVRSYLQNFSPNITFHEGDILQKTWDGKLIDLLFIDIDKTVQTSDHVAKTFFPSLKKDSSFLISQDFQHKLQPWCCVQMELFSDHFEYIGHCATNSTVFRLIKEITEEDCIEREMSQLIDFEFKFLISQAVARYAHTSIASHLRAMLSEIEMIGMWRSTVERNQKMSAFNNSI